MEQQLTRAIKARNLAAARALGRRETLCGSKVARRTDIQMTIQRIMTTRSNGLTCSGAVISSHTVVAGGDVGGGEVSARAVAVGVTAHHLCGGETAQWAVVARSTRAGAVRLNLNDKWRSKQNCSYWKVPTAPYSPPHEPGLHINRIPLRQ